MIDARLRRQGPAGIVRDHLGDNRGHFFVMAQQVARGVGGNVLADQQAPGLGGKPLHCRAQLSPQFGLRRAGGFTDDALHILIGNVQLGEQALALGKLWAAREFVEGRIQGVLLALQLVDQPRGDQAVVDDLGRVFLNQLRALQTDESGRHQKRDHGREADDENAQDLAIGNRIGIHAILRIAQMREPMNRPGGLFRLPKKGCLVLIPLTSQRPQRQTP